MKKNAKKTQKTVKATRNEEPQAISTVKTVEETKTEPVEAPAEETPAKETKAKAHKDPQILQEELAEARKNYRRTCEFTVTKTKTREIGIVRSARLDKRTDFIQYRIEIIAGSLMGQVYGKAWDSKDLEWLS